MKIVIISRNIYPKIAPRPMRATELAKYFAKIGHDVSLYAVLGSFDYTSFSSETGIKVKPIGKMHFAITNSDITQPKSSLLNRIATRLFGRALEFPDIELAWKMPGIIKKEPNTDLLITIAIPFPIHWGTAWAKKKLKNQFPKKWVSDCGDPYIGNSVQSKHPFYFQYIENFWGKQTDYISIPIETARKAYDSKVQNKIRIIPQGFDFSNINIDKTFDGNTVPHFAYAGIVYEKYRDPSSFLDYLCTLNMPFRFIVYTKSDSIFGRYKDKLGNKLEIHNYIPREELLLKLSRMDFLVNLLNNNSVQSPSKLIDYYLTGRPILDISSSFEERHNFECFMNRNYENQHIESDIEKYNIKNIGNKFLDL